GRAQGREGHHRSGSSGEHLGTIERERLRAEISGAGGIEHIHAHVISVWPDTEVRVIEEVRAEVKVITSPGAGRIVSRGNRNAFVRRNAGAGELSDDPAVRDLIVKHYRISEAARLANATKTAPERSNTDRPEQRSARGLIPYLHPFIDRLHILGLAHFTV